MTSFNILCGERFLSVNFIGAELIEIERKAVLGKADFKVDFRQNYSIYRYRQWIIFKDSTDPLGIFGTLQRKVSVADLGV